MLQHGVLISMSNAILIHRHQLQATNFTDLLTPEYLIQHTYALTQLRINTITH